MLQSKDFSVSGDSESGNRYTFILRITELSADVITNSSRLQVEAILKQSISGTGFSSWGTGVSCSLNGSEIFSDYAQRRISGKQEHVFYTWEGDISHNDDGSLQLSVTGRLWQNASASFTPPEMQVAGELALTIIARASSINASSGNIGETVMIAVGKKNDRFTHTIAYRFGAETGYIDADGNAAAQPAQLRTSSCAFRLPESFYNQIPDDPSGQCELVCTTYDGDVQVGTPQSCVFMATAEKQRCKPLISGQVRDIDPVTVALTGDENVLIRYASTACCTANAQPRCGAYLENVQVNGAEMPDLVLEIPNTESGSFVFRAVDTRGYESAVTVETQIVPYVKLTCNVQPGRTDPGTGIARARVEGSCYCGSFGAEDNALILHYAIAGDEVQSIELPIREDHTYSAELELPGLDYTQNYDLEIVVEDRVSSLAAPVRIGQAMPIFAWGKDYFRFHVPLFAPAINDRGVCYDPDTAVLPGVYRLEGGLLLVFASGDIKAQLAIGTEERKLRLITQQTVYDWEDL